MSSTRPSLDALRIDPDKRAAGDRAGGRRAPWIAALVVLLALAGGFWWWRAGAAPVVETATVRQASTVGGAGGPGAVLEASGYVTARRQATVSSKITGRVEEVLVEEGMRVADGQVLARLDAVPARRSLSLAQAELRAAESALAELAVRRDEARLTLGRAERLVAEGITDQAGLDSAQAAVDALEARIEAGRDQVSVARRVVDLRRQDLDDTVIRAPFAGVAISKNAQPGEIVSPMSAGGGFTRTGISTIVDMDSLEIEVDVNEAYINRVSEGQPVRAVLDAYPDWTIPGHVITTIPAADRQKATVKVRIAIDARDPRILPDMGVKVAFLDPAAGGEPAVGEAPPRPRLLVPRAALVERSAGAGWQVWVVEGDERLERRAVEIDGAAAGEAGEVAVVAGLAAGERVVVDPPAGLEDGGRVEIEDDDERSAT